MTMTKIISNILSDSQDSSLFSRFSDRSKPKTQKVIKCLIKNDCIYHKHWYEPVNNDNREPKHIQIDRCALDLQAMGDCGSECTSYKSHGPRSPLPR